MSAPSTTTPRGDFCDDLDRAAAGEREALIRNTLTGVIDTAGYLDESAVAAAALVAGQHPGGDPVDPVYGPGESLPDLRGLRTLALQALDRVMTKPSELMDLWNELDGGPWHATINRLQGVLRPQPPGEQLTLT